MANTVAGSGCQWLPRVILHVLHTSEANATLYIARGIASATRVGTLCFLSAHTLASNVGLQLAFLGVCGILHFDDKLSSVDCSIATP